MMYHCHHCHDQRHYRTRKQLLFIILSIVLLFIGKVQVDGFQLILPSSLSAKSHHRHQHHHNNVLSTLSLSIHDNDSDNHNTQGAPRTTTDNSNDGVNNGNKSKRKRILNFIAFKRLSNKNKDRNKKNDSNKKKKCNIEVTTVHELEDYFNDIHYNFRKKNKKKNNNPTTDMDIIDFDSLLKALIVKGDTQKIGSKPSSSSDPYFVHSVQNILHERRRHQQQHHDELNNNDHSNTHTTNTTMTSNNNQTSTKTDNHKVALVVEGGGMRGCVTAGMVTAIYYLGLEDTFDVIYGSSAGTIIGAYFNTRQLPWFGPEIYYDSLTTANKKFIDSKRLLRCMGVGLLDPRLIKDVILRPKYGKPVLNLDFLLQETMQIKKPLNWTKFVEMQSVQPLKVVSSGLNCGHSVVLDYQNGGFQSIQELALAMRSSCLLPGIAGPVVNVQKDNVRDNSDKSSTKPKYIVKNDVVSTDLDYEPMADALIFEPLPYQKAIDEGATHVVMLRSRPDGVDVTGKTSLFEKLILHRFFKRKNHLKHIYNYMRQHGHKKLYAKQVIELNDASNDANGNMMAIAVPPGSPEVPRLETGREAIFEGVRRGFARAYDCLVEDPNERGRGAIVAKQCLPDEILDYDPLLLNAGDMSAFEFFLNEKESKGEGYNFPSTLGQTAYEAKLPR